MLSTLDTISIGRPITTLLAVYWPELLAGLSVEGELPDGRPPRLEVALSFVRRLRHADRLLVDGVGLGRETRFSRRDQVASELEWECTCRATPWRREEARVVEHERIGRHVSLGAVREVARG
jgi:hypothetical protein